MHNRQKATADLIVGEKSIVNFIPAILSYSMVASSLPFLTFKISKALCSWLFIVLTARHLRFAISFFSYPCAYIRAVISHSGKFIKNSLHNRVSQLINNCE